MRQKFNKLYGLQTAKTRKKYLKRERTFSKIGRAFWSDWEEKMGGTLQHWGVGWGGVSSVTWVAWPSSVAVCP